VFARLALAILPCLFACGADGGSSSSASTARRGLPNILLISIDTLRADHLSSYGYSRVTSPVLDALAAEGALFENVFAQRAETWPSMTSILTSLYPHEHGVRHNGESLQATIPILPQLLKPHGYQTAAFLGNMKTAPHRGFDEKKISSTVQRDVGVNEAAMGWLRERAREPFFAWVHYVGPHRPYSPPKRFAERFVTEYDGPIAGATFEALSRVTLEKTVLSVEDVAHVAGLYDGEIAFVDSAIGVLLRALEERGASENTLVVIVGDHGEALYDRNFYFYHTCSIYDSTLHIPLILRWPGVVPAGTRVERVVEGIDIVPTIFELVGLPVLERFSGRSVAALATGASAQRQMGAPDARAFSELGPEVRSIRTRRWRYVENGGSKPPDCRPYRDAWQQGRADVGYEIAQRELYDLESDPDESVNVVDAHPDVAERMGRRLRAEFRPNASPTEPRRKLDPATRDELRAMGYVE
jgi:arylsulfatase A-like enzyme